MMTHCWFPLQFRKSSFIEGCKSGGDFAVPFRLSSLIGYLYLLCGCRCLGKVRLTQASRDECIPFVSLPLYDGAVRWLETQQDYLSVTASIGSLRYHVVYHGCVQIDSVSNTIIPLPLESFPILWLLSIAASF